MKAAVIEGPGKLTIRDLPQPEPAEYQALVQILFGGVCSGTDQHLVAGQEPFCRWFKAPAVLGHESVGRVVSVGPKVKHLKIGDVVTRVGTTPVGAVNVAWGGFAEYGVATDWRAMRDDGKPLTEYRGYRVQQVLPASVRPDQATMVITWRETYSYITRIGVKPHQHVLIVGSGGNALAFANHARNMGASKIVLIGNPARAAAAEKFGAQLIDYHASPIAPLVKAAAPEGYDLVIDAVGKAHALDPLIPLLKIGGHVGVYGLDDVASYAFNPITAPGSFTFYRGHYDEYEAHDSVIRLMQAGLLDASHYLTNLANPFPLADITQAIEASRNRSCIKALVKVTP